jgi:class 3 adenylate cyclase
MPDIDEARLEERLEQLETARAWSPRVVSKLENLIRLGEDRALLRVNPLAFARERSVAEGEGIDLFLWATKLGLFQMDWHLLCPACGQVVESFTALKNLHAGYRCALCHSDYSAKLDDYIEVSFTVASGIRRIRYHAPETLEAPDYLVHYRHSPLCLLPNGRPLSHMLGESFWLGSLLPGESTERTLDFTPGMVSGAIAPTDGEILVAIDDRENDGTPLEITATPLETVLSQPAIGQGPRRVRVVNHTDARLFYLVGSITTEQMAMPGPETVLGGFLTGHRVLNSQTFRDLFRTETIGREGLQVKEVALLFTDLKGSTSLYERIGDLRAFQLVQQHFDRLDRAVQANHGAIVKTIGDAVMASFTSPAEAVRAALMMLSEIDKFNAETGARDLVLKVGVHAGASIAVTLNDRIDWFGQTVNVAARVQGLADADEIYLTEAVYRAPSVRELIAGSQVDFHEAQLRGIEQRMGVYRVRG